MNEFNNYAERGSFEYTGGDNNWNRLVNSVVTKKQKGVYCMKVGDEIVYIGKGGSVYQDGSWGGQGLQRRLINRRGKDADGNSMSTKVWINNWLSDMGKTELTVCWAVTFEDDPNGIKDIPAYVEAKLLQKFFDVNNKLPRWNIEF